MEVVPCVSSEEQEQEEEEEEESVGKVMHVSSLV
jgi:hypothetical protein